mmetsp:Transcript_11982/g.11702  ORF Transcript_11982/g.11702 Transcript_11982/m.11702 type:complete len:117 (+) Transcript_11982:521-871(+)
MLKSPRRVMNTSWRQTHCVSTCTTWGIEIKNLPGRDRDPSTDKTVCGYYYLFVGTVVVVVVPGDIRRLTHHNTTMNRPTKRYTPSNQQWRPVVCVVNSSNSRLLGSRRRLYCHYCC